MADEPLIPRNTQWPSIGLFIVALFAILVIAQTFFVPLVLSFLIALTFSPIRRAFGEIGIGPGFSAVVILAIVIGVLVALFFGLATTLSTRLEEAPDLVDDAIRRLQLSMGVIEPMMEASEQIEKITDQADTPETVVVREAGPLSVLTDTTPAIAGQIVFALTMSFFLIASGDMFYVKLVEVMPSLKEKKRALDIAQDIEEQLSTYFLTITLINVALGAAIGVVLWMLGVPDPLLFGVLAFLLNYIPYIGAMFGVGLTFFVTFAMGATVVEALVPAGAYWALTSLEGQFVTPYLVGRRLKMNAVVVLLSLAVWAWLWSLMGMFLSTPMLIMLNAFSSRVNSLAWLSRFLSGKGEVSGWNQAVLKGSLKKVAFRSQGKHPNTDQA